MNDLRRIDASALATWAATVLASCNVPDASARSAANILVDANLTGVDTHGIARLKTYVELLKNGQLNARPGFTCKEIAGALDFDADRGLGQLAGAAAVARALDLAQGQSIVGMTIKHTGHMGALGNFTAQVAKAGMIGVLVQNGPPVMGLPGVTRAAIGNNPLAFSAPVPNAPPIVFDIATSEAAYGKIIEAARAGQAIPQGWAIDRTGAATTDAAAALEGTLLPAGGHKGVGLSMLVECLAGGLTGMIPRLTQMTAHGMPAYFGAFLLVVNPALLIGQAAFESHVADWLSVYKSAGPNSRYPGERLALLREERQRTGIPIGPALVATMRTLGDEAGHAFPAHHPHD